MKEHYIDIKRIAAVKGLKSTRSIRIAIQKGKYIAREVKVNGGTSYEVLYSSLESEIQEKLENEEIKSTALIPVENKVNFISENAKLNALARVDIVTALFNLRTKYQTKKEADEIFLDLYNSGMYLPQIYKFVGSISIGTLHRWVKAYENYGTNGLLPQRRTSQQNEYNTILNNEMKQVFLKYLLHPNQFSIGKAINLTNHVLEKRGYEDIPCNLTFRRFAEHFKKTNYSKWILMREGEKAYHDKVEAYIERDISKLEVGDVLIADGHVLNFQVINPFTGKPTRATLVGFLDWKSTALVGYEIMMTENTQCIASALRNSILNLGLIPKVVYQDNGKAFKAKYFQHTDFDEAGFNGVYSNLGIKSVFAKPYNARAKIIERFFLEFQEEFEKMMPSYIGTSIEDKPAWLKRGEKLHKQMHQKATKNYIPTVQEVIKYIDCWIDYHNSKPCPNDNQMTIKECLNSIQKQNIDTRRLRRIQKNMSGKAYELFSKYIEKGNISKFADELKNRLDSNFMDTMEILRNKDFQDLLINYPRNDKSFIRALDAIDEVTSGRVNRYDGTSTSTTDYINGFCEFVKQNKESIEAIRILFNSPKDWNTNALKSIKELLKQNDYKIETLQKIHGAIYHKSLVDIISMIKHAAKDDEELLTAEERVTRAINTLRTEIQFNEEQEQWLELIKNHLIENLTIDVDDFEFLPIFARKGGIGKAKRVFDNILDKIIAKLNELMAA